MMNCLTRHRAAASDVFFLTATTTATATTTTTITTITNTKLEPRPVTSWCPGKTGTERIGEGGTPLRLRCVAPDFGQGRAAVALLEVELLFAHLLDLEAPLQVPLLLPFRSLMLRVGNLFQRWCIRSWGLQALALCQLTCPLRLGRRFLGTAALLHCQRLRRFHDTRSGALRELLITKKLRMQESSFMLTWPHPRIIIRVYMTILKNDHSCKHDLTQDRTWTHRVKALRSCRLS